MTNEAMKARPIRMTDEEWEKCKALGGAEWVRERIRRADLDKSAAKQVEREAKLAEDKRRYLYTHASPCGAVFYVGLGTMKRSKLFAYRSPEHAQIVQEIGRENVVVTVYELERGLSPYAQERRLMARMLAEGHKLCNRTPP